MASDHCDFARLVPSHRNNCGSESLQAGQVVKSTFVTYGVSSYQGIHCTWWQHGNGKPGLKCLTPTSWSTVIFQRFQMGTTWSPPKRCPEGSPKGSPIGAGISPSCITRWIISWAKSRSWPSCSIPSSSTCPGTHWQTLGDALHVAWWKHSMLGIVQKNMFIVRICEDDDCL